MAMFDQIEQGEIRRLARKEIDVNIGSTESILTEAGQRYWDQWQLEDSLYMNGSSLGTAPHDWKSATGASFQNSTIAFGTVTTLSTTTTANSRADIRNADQDVAIAPSQWYLYGWETNGLDFQWRGRVTARHSNVGKTAGQALITVGIYRTHGTNNQVLHGFVDVGGEWWIVVVSEYIEYYSFNTGISTTDTHTLRIETNTQFRNMNFYIDGTLIQSLTNGIGGVVFAAENPALTGMYYGCQIRQRGTGNPILQMEVEEMLGKRSILEIANEVLYDISVNSLSLRTNPNVTNLTPLGPGQFVYDIDYNGPTTALEDSQLVAIGQAIYKRIRNNGSQINKGQVVYVTGSHGSTNITVALADASSESTAATTIGVASMDIPPNNEGWIITQGYLKGFDTNGTAGTGGEGSILWLSETAGAFTYTRPASPAHSVVVGWMVKSAGTGAGSIFVKITNGQELEELHDVNITSLANKHVLQYSSTDTVWQNKSLQSAGIMEDPCDPTTPVCFWDDFMNANNETGEVGIVGWNFVNVTLPQVAGELTHPGIIRIRCSGTANQVGYLTTALTNAGGTNQFNIDNLTEFTIIFRENQIDQDCWRTYGVNGVATSATGQPSGVYIRKNNVGIGGAGTWQLVTRTAAGAETATAWIGQDINWHKMKVTYSSTSVSFYMDGATTPTATHTTNIPTNLVVAPYMVLTPTANTIVRTSDWDFISIKLGALSR